MEGCCATCKHWDAEVWDEQLELHICNAVPHFSGSREWSSAASERVVRAEFANCKAFVEDGSGYRAELLTMADFGCTAYEEKV